MRKITRVSEGEGDRIKNHLNAQRRDRHREGCAGGGHTESLQLLPAVHLPNSQRPPPKTFS